MREEPVGRRRTVKGERCKWEGVGGGHRGGWVRKKRGSKGGG